MKAYLNRLAPVLGSRGFFLSTLAFFIFQAVWIAFSAAYPMAFDEDFHFGIIRVYSHYWLPFLNGQPPGADTYGAVARDPSYLYHYLMSYPYRLIASIFHGQASQIISLRLIDVVLFCIGLVVFRQVLLKVGMSRAFTNISLLLFTLIPIVPQLAGQINYDNLVIPLTAWACLLTLQAIDELRRQRPSVRAWLTIIIVCLFTSLVKYAFLPICVAIVLYLSYEVFRNFRGHPGKLLSILWSSWATQKRYVQFGLITLSIISLGLFIQRDGYNVIKYHTVVPNCSRVLTVKQCSAYSVWYRDYTKHADLLANKSTPVTYYNPIEYLGVWVYWLWYRLFFAVNGPTSNYTNYPPLPLPSAAAAILAIAGVLAVFVWRKHIFNNPYFTFFLLASGIYMLALGIDGYTGYHYTDELIDMNGRYLLPILLFVATLFGRAFSLSLRHSPIWKKAALALVAILLFLQGGGFLTFITRSDMSWDQPNKAVVRANNAARKITKPVIIKGSKSYSTSVWLFN